MFTKTYLLVCYFCLLFPGFSCLCFTAGLDTECNTAG